MNKQLIPAREVAARVGVSTRTVHAWANDGRIPSLRLAGNHLRFDWEEVLEVIRRGDRRASKEVLRGE